MLIFISCIIAKKKCEIGIALRKPKNAPLARTSKVSPKWVGTRTSQIATAHRNSQLAIAHRKSCFESIIYQNSEKNINKNYFELISVSVGTTATAVFFAVISIIAASFSFRFIPETCEKNVEELSFLYRRKAMVMDPTELITMTMDLPRSRKMTVEEYDDHYLSYVTIGDLERSDL